MVESNESIVKKLIDKIAKLEIMNEIQQCYINVSQRVSDELKLQFDNLAQEKEERLVIVRAKIDNDETSGSLGREEHKKINETVDKENLTELLDITKGIKSVHRIGRRKGNSQDILLV